MFTVISGIVGFVANLLAIIQMVKNKNNDEQEEKSGNAAWLFVIGIVALIAMFAGIGLGNLDTDKITSVLFTPINGDDINTYSESETVNVDDVYSAVQEKTGKVWIEDMQVLAYDGNGRNRYSNEQNILLNTGEYIDHTLVFEANDFYDAKFQTIDFYLNKKYDSFNALLALSDEDKDTRSEYIVSFQLDGETELEFKFERGFLPKDIYLNVTDVDLLRIKITNIKYGKFNSETTDIVLGDAYFTKK